MKVLNPFAFSLGKKEKQFYEIDTKPIYENGVYKTYKFDKNWFVTCRGNIIVTEATSVPARLINHLVSGKEPDDYTKYHYRDVLQIWPYALQCAEMVGFEVMEA